MWSKGCKREAVLEPGSMKGASVCVCVCVLDHRVHQTQGFTLEDGGESELLPE